jgi:hypothetical protein
MTQYFISAGNFSRTAGKKAVSPAILFGMPVGIFNRRSGNINCIPEHENQIHYKFIESWKGYG